MPNGARHSWVLRSTLSLGPAAAHQKSPLYTHTRLAVPNGARPCRSASEVAVVHAHEAGGAKRRAAQRALGLLVVPGRDAGPAEHVAAGHRSGHVARAQAQRAAPLLRHVRPLRARAQRRRGRRGRLAAILLPSNELLVGKEHAACAKHMPALLSCSRAIYCCYVVPQRRARPYHIPFHRRDTKRRWYKTKQQDPRRCDSHAPIAARRARPCI